MKNLKENLLPTFNQYTLPNGMRIIHEPSASIAGNEDDRSTLPLVNIVDRNSRGGFKKLSGFHHGKRFLSFRFHPDGQALRVSSLTIRERTCFVNKFPKYPLFFTEQSCFPIFICKKRTPPILSSDAVQKPVQ